MLTTRLQHKLLPLCARVVNLRGPGYYATVREFYEFAPRPGPDESELRDMMICVSVSLVELPKAIQWPIKTATTVETSSQRKRQ